MTEPVSSFLDRGLVELYQRRVESPQPGEEEQLEAELTSFTPSAGKEIRWGDGSATTQLNEFIHGEFEAFVELARALFQTSLLADFLDCEKTHSRFWEFQSESTNLFAGVGRYSVGGELGLARARYNANVINIQSLNMELFGLESRLFRSIGRISPPFKSMRKQFRDFLHIKMPEALRENNPKNRVIFENLLTHIPSLTEVVEEASSKELHIKLTSIQTRLEGELRDLNKLINASRGADLALLNDLNSLATDLLSFVTGFSALTEAEERKLLMQIKQLGGLARKISKTPDKILVAERVRRESVASRCDTSPVISTRRTPETADLEGFSERSSPIKFITDPIDSGEGDVDVFNGQIALFDLDL